MRKGTRKILSSDYFDFVNAMLVVAEQDELPFGFQVTNLDGLTFQDFKDFFNDFYNDTGLNITGHLFVCDDCGEIHMLIEVDNFEEDEILQ